MPFCGCWLWERYINKGYGRIGFNSRYFSTHRFSYLAFKGPFPKEMYVCHNCDTPSCVNPAHLFLSTFTGNMEDMVQKKRQAMGKQNGMFGRQGEKSPRAKLKDEQIQEIFRLSEEGWKQKDIASKFKISDRHIRDIQNKKYWKHL